MKHLKKFNNMESETPKSVNEKVLPNDANQLEYYQKLFDESYKKGDKANCAKYDRILIDLYQKL